MKRKQARSRASAASNAGAVIGVSDHCGWAVLMTAAAEATLIDRRRVELVDAELPKLPYHHDAQKLPIAEAIGLIERVRASAERHAAVALDAVAAAVLVRIVGISIRKCPALPPTIPERLADYRAQNVADTVMYRQALASAAEARGWSVHWYDRRNVFEAASAALRVHDMADHLARLRAAIGPPWTKDHQLALAAAVAAHGARALEPNDGSR